MGAVLVRGRQPFFDRMVTHAGLERNAFIRWDTRSTVARRGWHPRRSGLTGGGKRAAKTSLCSSSEAWPSTCCPAGTKRGGRLRPIPLRLRSPGPMPSPIAKEKTRARPLSPTAKADARPSSSRLGVWKDGHQFGYVSGSATRERRPVPERPGARPTRSGAGGS